LHAATAVPNHIVSELQDLRPPVGITVDHDIEDGAFVLGDGAGLGILVDEQAIRALDSLPLDDVRTTPSIRPERAGRRLLAEPAPPRPVSAR
jgi:hypothetical protein